MEESQIILQLHESILKTNRDLRYFKDECAHKFNRQKRINRFLIYCLMYIVAKKSIKQIKKINEKGASSKK